ncbi:hypothetical protein SAMN02799630_00228 [Paenibacillus sp. UNCCL117]|uniref:hypothetical protein n=1 Tax=unclassified Paenibacillus TaxID=185978 RepID=UPI00088F5458|nr:MULTISPECIES: hypothetical protein [unclassified Paenibacillus]SDC47586.1 hypothetical protein SAMN04488602_102303 [Paenibacillus sp. cl123]SFW12101.1 hypothetical protein SAMN02799630_00228 [Paenibacillus sp. UNCCL117]
MWTNWTASWVIAGIVAAGIAAWMLVKVGRKVRDKAEANKVIKMSLYKARSGRSGKSAKEMKGNKKTCSFCKKKSGRLAFYANETGQVIGVCDACRPQAERRMLNRL